MVLLNSYKIYKTSNSGQSSNSKVCIDEKLIPYGLFKPFWPVYQTLFTENMFQKCFYNYLQILVQMVLLAWLYMADILENPFGFNREFDINLDEVTNQHKIENSWGKLNRSLSWTSGGAQWQSSIRVWEKVEVRSRERSCRGRSGSWSGLHQPPEAQ